MTYKDIPVELAKLKTLLSNQEISWEDALGMIKTLTNNFQSWKTAWWEKTRQEFMQDHCEQCGASGEGVILVLQHTWHPASLQEIRSLHYTKYQKNFPFTDKEKAEIEQQISPDEPPLRLACPHCSSLSIRYRKKVANWICIKCNKEFTESISIQDKIATNQQNYAVKQALWQKKGQERYARFLADNEYQRIVILKMIDEGLRYLSFQDTVTYCKRCAFAADKLGMIICPLCKTNYMGRTSDICNKCRYGDGTGIYTLTRVQGRRWLRHSIYSGDCRAKYPDDQSMEVYICLLQKQNLEPIEVHTDYIRIGADIHTLWKAITGRIF